MPQKTMYHSYITKQLSQKNPKISAADVIIFRSAFKIRGSEKAQFSFSHQAYQARPDHIIVVSNISQNPLGDP
jgi:hypothetical protein